jgi:hypothetical protein
LSFIDLERGGFGEILPEVMIFSEGLCPVENIITEISSRCFIFELTQVSGRFSFESHIVWNINDNISQNLFQNFEKAPGYSSLINTIYILSAILLSCLLSRVVCANNVLPPCSPGNMGWNIVKRNAGSLIDDVRRDIAINFMLTCHKLSFLTEQLEVEV